jgi:hypothetical protein
MGASSARKTGLARGSAAGMTVLAQIAETSLGGRCMGSLGLEGLDKVRLFYINVKLRGLDHAGCSEG